MNPARLRAYIELLITVIIWGVAASVIKFGLSELSPFTFLAYRYFITTIVLLPFFILVKGKGQILRYLPMIILISLLGSTLNHALLFYGAKLSTSLDTSLITATAPILVIIAGAIFLKEHITHKEKVGIAVILLGTIAIILQSLLEGGPNAHSSLIGNILLFSCNIIFTGYLILSKKVLQNGISPFALTFMTFLVGFITTLPFSLRETGISNFLPHLLNLDLSIHLSVIYMSIFSGALAYWLYQKAQKTIEASEASVFQYLQPVVTAPVAIIWLGEKLTLPIVFGSVLIGLGVFLAEWKKKRYN